MDPHDTFARATASSDAARPVSRRTRASARSGTRSRPRVFLRNASWAILVGAIVLALWPAHLGGVTGFTVVNGHSMEPTYVTGDLVLTLQQSHYEVDDVISYVVPEGQPGEGGRVIHRIIEQQGSANAPQYLTQGDNNAEADPWIIAPTDIVGRARGHLPGLGRLLGSNSYPLMVAGAAAVIVLVFLWPSRKQPFEDDE